MDKIELDPGSYDNRSDHQGMDGFCNKRFQPSSQSDLKWYQSASRSLDFPFHTLSLCVKTPKYRPKIQSSMERTQCLKCISQY